MKRIALVALIAFGGCSAGGDERPRFVGGFAPVGDFRAPVHSVIERKFTGVVRQRYDFSCGSAALATLLRYHYDLAVDEAAAFRGMWARGDKVQIRRLGFSLLDMKRWLQSRGLSGNGYKVSLDKVAQTGIPGIALIAIKQYRHFVVVKGIRSDAVLLGDSSSGLRIMPRAEFERAWNGIYFALAEDQSLARTKFNRDRQWAAFATAPIGGAFADPVSQQALALTAPFYGDIS